MIWIVIY